MILVRQLGNGGAFTPQITNTAFTLFDDKILVDCGYNVFQKLLENKNVAEKIEYVFITHEHDDHVGSLMSFLYWVEFIRQTPIAVYMNDYALELFKSFYLKGKTYYPHFNNVPFDYVRIYALRNINSTAEDANINRWATAQVKLDSIDIRFITQKTHGHFYNTSYIFEHHDINIDVLITGDTKANLQLAGVMRKHADTGSTLYVFHDYSNSDSPHNIHANANDLRLYGDLIDAPGIHFYKVHTGIDKLITIEI